MPTSKRYYVEEHSGFHVIIDSAEHQRLHRHDIVELLNIYEDGIRELRDALQALYDEQNGSPLVRDADDWHEAMRQAESVLAKYKEDEE